jgi:hypothetical protein
VRRCAADCLGGGRTDARSAQQGKVGIKLGAWSTSGDSVGTRASPPLAARRSQLGSTSRSRLQPDKKALHLHRPMCNGVIAQGT